MSNGDVLKDETYIDPMLGIPVHYVMRATDQEGVYEHTYSYGGSIPVQVSQAKEHHQTIAMENVEPTTAILQILDEWTARDKERVLREPEVGE
jgi:hypothetical protein